MTTQNQQRLISSIDEFNEFNSTARITDYYRFSNCIIDIELSLQSARSLEFENCVFKQKVNLSRSYPQVVNFQRCCFEGEVNFDFAQFDKKVLLQSCTFQSNVTFENTKFKALCDFWGSVFTQPTIFYKTDFFETVVFSRAIFRENALFTYSLFEGVTIFRAASFLKGLDLSTANITGSLNFFDFRLGKFKSINKKLSEHEVEEAVSSDSEIPINNKIETYRIIRKQFDSQNNHIAAAEFYSLELFAQFEDLKASFFRRKAKRENLFILLLNLLSNKFGKSWLRGVFFTMLIGLLFFLTTLISTKQYSVGFDLSKKNIDEFGRLFFEFLTPTHKVDFLDDKGPSLWSYFFDFWGRVFVAFGIYQTIQAFRKYRT
jgi:uncharacterized protein YjbI with pentapeptide repeats